MGTRSRWRDAACFTCAKSRTDACRREVHLGLWCSRARCGDEAVRVYAQWPRCRVTKPLHSQQRFIFPFPRVQKNQRREGRLRDTRCCHVRTHPARNFLSLLSHRPRLTSSELANWRILQFSWNLLSARQPFSLLVGSGERSYFSLQAFCQTARPNRRGQGHPPAAEPTSSIDVGRVRRRAGSEGSLPRVAHLAGRGAARRGGERARGVRVGASPAEQGAGERALPAEHAAGCELQQQARGEKRGGAVGKPRTGREGQAGARYTRRGGGPRAR